jgi:hypothetical protein
MVLFLVPQWAIAQDWKVKTVASELYPDEIV